MNKVLVVFLSVLVCAFDLISQTNQPNIIFLLTDDQRWDMIGANGNNIIQTPHIDSLAAKGTNFKNHYVTTAICSVSRASILSGQYGRSHGLWGFGQGFSEEAFQETYPMVLKDHGYYTGFIGKYGVGPIAMPKDAFDYWEGFGGQGTYHHQNDDGSYLHLTEKIGGQMVDFLDQRDTSKPFCLSVSFKSPHVQDGAPPNPKDIFPADPRYNLEYEDAEWSKPSAASPSYFDHFPKHFTDGNEAVKRYETRFSTDQKYDESLEGYYRLVHGVDVQIGRLLNELRTHGLDQNTIIVFSSDHGFYLGEYGFAGKWYGSEPSIKAPLVIYDPRSPKAQRPEAFSLNIDIAPTILAFAGVPIPSSYDGVSLLPVIDDTNSTIRDTFYYEHLWPANTGYHIPSTEGVITKDYKYMRYFEGMQPDQIIFEELYDRRSDTEELRNLHLDASSATLKRDMAKAVDFFFQQNDPSVDNEGTTVYPFQDAYLRDGPYENVIFGLEDLKSLQVKKSNSTGFSRQAILSFDLDYIPIDASKVELNFTAESPTATQVSMMASSHSPWAEYDLNWNKANLPVQEDLANLEILEGSQDYTIDISSQINKLRSEEHRLIDIWIDGKESYIGNPISILSRENADDKPHLKFGTILFSDQESLPRQLVYPNPVTDVLQIPKWQDYSRLELYDTKGNLLFESDAASIIDFTSFSRGVFFLRLIRQSGEMDNYRVIKI